MPWIRYVGPVDRVHVPYWGIGAGAPDGNPGWPRLEPLQVPQDARDGLVHPDGDWQDCDSPLVLIGEHGPELALPAGEVG